MFSIQEFKRSFWLLSGAYTKEGQEKELETRYVSTAGIKAQDGSGLD